MRVIPPSSPPLLPQVEKGENTSASYSHSPCYLTEAAGALPLLSHQLMMGQGAMLSACRRGGHAPSTESTGYRTCLAVGMITTDGLMLLLHGADPAGQGVETNKAFGMALVIHFIGPESGEVFGVEAVR